MEDKKPLIIAIAAIAVIVAVAVIYWTYSSQQIQVVKTADAGTGTNPKVLYMKSQKEAQQQGKEGAAGKEEKDPNAIGDK